MDLVNRVRYLTSSRQRSRRDASTIVEEVGTNFMALLL